MTTGSAPSSDEAVEHFDAVIVGSGFGGSVMAARLAEKGWSVCVLERGKAYPPGSFPRSPQAMAANTWDPSEGFYGLFDFWTFPGLSSIVSSGLGGGSLIYSNVMLRKPEEWFVADDPMPGGGHESWPITYGDLVPHYEAVERGLHVTPYPIGQDPYSGTGRTHAVLEAGDALGHEAFTPNLAVTFGNDPLAAVPGEQIVEDVPSLHGLPRSTCRLVAECNLGCNYGSKNSLDHTYLSRAQRAGAVIRTLSEVKRFWPEGEQAFLVDYVEHDQDRTSRSAEPHLIRCKRLVLSAGTFGSTYLLLKNSAALPGLSSRLGKRFSANGDYLGLAIKARRDLRPRPMDASFGAAITATFKVPRMEGSHALRGAYVQDAGYPDLVNWMLNESLPLMAPRVLRFLVSQVGRRVTGRQLASMNSALRDVLGKAQLTVSTTPLVGMGRDVPSSTFELTDGLLDLDWRVQNSQPYFDHMDDVLEDVGDTVDAEIVATLRHLNRIVTVHPLGGCPMGVSPELGVVDPYGEVFNHERLVVADGSVMPGPVGANPSLTIAAFADRAADKLIAGGP
jgi:cholesterol oxidase